MGISPKSIIFKTDIVSARSLVGGITAPVYATGKAPIVVKSENKTKKTMALLKKTKIAIFESRPYEVVGKDGKTYQGFIVKGFEPSGEVLRFSSKNDIKAHDLGGYDETLAIELNLFGKEFQGETRWSTEKAGTPTA